MPLADARNNTGPPISRRLFGHHARARSGLTGCFTSTRLSSHDLPIPGYNARGMGRLHYFSLSLCAIFEMPLQCRAGVSAGRLPLDFRRRLFLFIATFTAQFDYHAARARSLSSTGAAYLKSSVTTEDGARQRATAPRRRWQGSRRYRAVYYLGECAFFSPAFDATRGCRQNARFIISPRFNVYI